MINIFKIMFVVLIYIILSNELYCKDNLHLETINDNKNDSAKNFNYLIKESNMICLATINKIENYIDCIHIELRVARTFIGDSSIRIINLSLFTRNYRYGFENVYSTYLIFLQKYKGNYELMNDLYSFMKIETIWKEEINFNYNSKSKKKIMELFYSKDQTNSLPALYISGILEDPTINSIIFPDDSTQNYFPSNLHIQIGWRTLQRRFQQTYKNVLVIPYYWLETYIIEKLKKYKRIK